MIKEVTVSKKLFQILNVAQLMPGEYQPRKQFDPLALEKLAETIKEVGILMPLLVRPKSTDKYEIIAGERRWRAAQIAGTFEIPCIVSDEPDEQALIKGLIENLSREDLNPIEEAQGIDKLIKEFHLTHVEAGRILGKSRGEVSNLLRLLELDRNIFTLLMDGDLNETHGRLLAGLPFSEQYPLARKAAIKKWSTRDLEREIKKLKTPNADSINKNSHLSSDSKRLERQLIEYLGAAVKLEEKGKQKGEIRILYQSLDELDGILIKIGLLNKVEAEY